MTKQHIPHQALVVVADGRKALFLRNLGDEVYPDLRVVRVMADEYQPHTAELGTDKPGRMLDRASGHHSTVAQPDWHEIAEHSFAREVSAALEKAVREGEVKAMIVVAPPKCLADLRGALSDRVKPKILAEIAKDLTKHPVHEIERLVTGGNGA